MLEVQLGQCLPQLGSQAANQTRRHPKQREQVELRYCLIRTHAAPGRAALLPAKRCGPVVKCLNAALPGGISDTSGTAPSRAHAGTLSRAHHPGGFARRTPGNRPRTPEPASPLPANPLAPTAARRPRRWRRQPTGMPATRTSCFGAGTAARLCPRSERSRTSPRNRARKTGVSRSAARWSASVHGLP